MHAWNNLVSACKKCNAKKGDNTPEAAGMELKRKPFKPSYALFLRDINGSNQNEWDEFLVNGH